MQAAVVNTLIEIPAMWDVGGKVARRGVRSEWGPLMQRWLFSCKDGYVTWKWFVDRGRGRRNRGLMEWMRDEGADDGVADWDYEALTLYSLTQEQVDHMEATVQRFFSTRTKAEIYSEALTRRFLCFPVHTPEDIVVDPQMRARGFFRALRHPGREAAVLYPGRSSPAPPPTMLRGSRRRASASTPSTRSRSPASAAARPSHCAELE